MRIVNLFMLALLGYSLEMETLDPPLEKIKTNDLAFETSNLMENMQLLKDKVNPSLESTNYILDTPEFHAIITPELKLLETIFKKYDFEIRIVGGAVRDLLDGKKPHDLDFATTATPTEMKNMFEKEGIRTVRDRCEKHYTIVPHINKVNFEITTLQCYILMNEGHAVLQFTKDWKIDAASRDLTINSMSLDFQGTVYDYFNGHEDLKARRVVFIGNPDNNIKQNYFHILRYFRFFSQFAINPKIHDDQTLKAIRENGAGLVKIPGERIWSELSQILLGKYFNDIIKKILDLGLGQYIGLNHPDHLDMFCFNMVCRNADKYSFKPITIIAALLKTDDEVLTFDNRVRLSKFERDIALYIVNHKKDELPAAIKNRLKHFQKSVMSSNNRVHCHAFIMELLKVLNEQEILKMFESWNIPIFPVDKDFLGEKGITGRDRVELLKKLRREWIANDFILDDKVISKLISQFRTEKNG